MPTRASSTSRRGLERVWPTPTAVVLTDLWETSKRVNFLRFTSLVVCAFCGFVKQGSHQGWLAVAVLAAKAPAPYVVTNPAGQEYAKCDAKWWACPHCKKPANRFRRAQWLPQYADQYLTCLYSLHPLQGMLLSFLDISANFADRCKSFLKGGFRPSSLFDCTYLTWNNVNIQNLFSPYLPTALDRLLTTCLNHNPLYKRHLCLCETPGHPMYLPVLTEESVQTLMGTHKTRKPLQDTADDLVDCQLGLVTDVTARPVDHVPSMHMPLTAGLLRLDQHGFMNCDDL